MGLEMASFDLLPQSLPSFARGFTAALIATVSCYPLDTIRRHIQLQASAGRSLQQACSLEPPVVPRSVLLCLRSLYSLAAAGWVGGTCYLPASPVPAAAHRGRWGFCHLAAGRTQHSVARRCRKHPAGRRPGRPVPRLPAKCAQKPAQQG